MGRGESCGGGQSSLGYLFRSGDGETDNNAQPPPEKPSEDVPTTEPEPTETSPKPSDDINNMTETEPSRKDPSESYSIINQNPNASTHDSTTNNYHRADGQNCGNFITNRPSTKVHAAPGGHSSIGFLFSDKEK